MRLLIDGVAFQFAQSGIARIWQSILPALVAEPGLDVMILDRGGLLNIARLKRIPFPSYREYYTADDSILIQKVCDRYDVDVFTSTYYTTPLITPMFLLVHDMTLGTPGYDGKHRLSLEKELTILFAQHHIGVPRDTEDELLGSWGTMASAVIDATRRLATYRSRQDYREFAERWSTLRRMQSEVDVERWQVGGVAIADN